MSALGAKSAPWTISGMLYYNTCWCITLVLNRTINNASSSSFFSSPSLDKLWSCDKCRMHSGNHLPGSPYLTLYLGAVFGELCVASLVQTCQEFLDLLRPWFNASNFPQWISVKYVNLVPDSLKFHSVLGTKDSFWIFSPSRVFPSVFFSL